MKISVLPKQEKFYTYLIELTSKAKDSAHLLKRYVVASDAADRGKIGQEIAARRAESKGIMAHMTDELCRSFITPFDREDIQQFSQYLYRIPKMVQRVTQRMELHGLSNVREDFGRQVKLIIDEAEAMEDMVASLIRQRNTKQVMQKVQLLHDLEQKGDDVLQELLASLFAEGRDVKDLILRKDIYDMLERLIDCYRNAASVMLQIVLKYS